MARVVNTGGKGSGRRPAEVSQEVVDANWDRIFGKKNQDPNYGLDFSKLNESGVKLPATTVPLKG